MKRWIIAVLSGMAAIACLSAQDETEDAFWEDWAEENEASEWRMAEEELDYLRQHPIDLNQATKEDLERLPFLSPYQREELALYLYRHSPLKTLSELLLVAGWDAMLFRRLRPYVCLIPTYTIRKRVPLGRRLLQGKSTLFIKNDAVLQAKAGYGGNDSLKELSKAYLGNRLNATLQYRYTVPSIGSVGCCIDKDAGEKGPDFLSGFADLRLGDWRILAGDYRVRLGQGLVVGGPMYGGKSSADKALFSPMATLRPHTGSSSYGFRRGLAAQGSLGSRFDLTAFLSWRQLDSNREGDSFATLYEDGLHRTLKERSRRGNLPLWEVGGQFRIEAGPWLIAANALYYRFGAEWQASEAYYALFRFQGRQGAAASIEARWKFTKGWWDGEISFDEKGGFAMLSSLLWKPHTLVSNLVSLRHIGRTYRNPFAQCFAGGSSLPAQTGVFVMSRWELLPRCQLVFYADLVDYPWFRYGVNGASQQAEAWVQAEWNPNNKVSIRSSLKSRLSRHNLTADQAFTGIAPTQLRQTEHWGLNAAVTEDIWRIKLGVRINRYAHGGEIGWGKGASLEGRINLLSDRVEAYAEAAVFDTDTYENRVTFYTPDLAASMPFSTLSGRGAAYSLLLKWKFCAQGSLMGRWKTLIYDDRDSLGDGLETIQGNTRSQAGFTLSWTFGGKPHRQAR